MAATHAPLRQGRRIAAPSVEADNVAVVRLWWMVLESEWRTVIAEGDDDRMRAGGIVTPSIRDALAAFSEFEARASEFLAVGADVIMSLDLRGRTRGCDRELAMSEVWVCRVVEAAVVEVRAYPTLNAARDAASVSL